jgi:hypothetical protein
MRVNGALAATVTNSAANTRDITGIGVGIGLSAPTRGAVYALACLDRTMDAAEVTAMEAYLASKYGVTLS